MTEKEIKEDISTLKRSWSSRKTKFNQWYTALRLVDTLKAEKMESVVVNDPRTFFSMAHYLLTTGETRHISPVVSDSPTELDKQATIERGIQYMWRLVDSRRQHNSNPSFLSELNFYLLLLGWYSLILSIDENGLLIPHLWSPANVFPRFSSNNLAAAVHSYTLPVQDAISKASAKGWNYNARMTSGNVTLDDYFFYDEYNILQNIIFIDEKNVTDIICRDDMMLLISPVGGFPDRGSLLPGVEWQGLIGQGILETNMSTNEALNKQKSFEQQILRTTAEPKYQEFSASPQATPEHLREHSPLFHYAPGEAGLQPVAQNPIPLEIRTSLLDMEKRMAKGSFSDAVYGMVAGQPGYALSQLASSSANQILYPYMEAKHFILAECDKFWLKNLKKSGKVFRIRGKLDEKLHPVDIPDDADILVESDLATQRDWMERATIANMMRQDVDGETLLSEVYKLSDTQGIRRRKNLDRFRDHPMTQQLELTSSYYAHADYLEFRGDKRQAALFRRAAQALEMQLGVPPPGAAKPAEALEAEAARAEAAPERRPRVAPGVTPPEARGFTPAQLREMIGRGHVKS
ncbi:MAG: hypothetical protein DDT33_01416 [Firmicutes bacterium]|nr:hypothetical protein [Bacillota bacterium]